MTQVAEFGQNLVALDRIASLFVYLLFFDGQNKDSATAKRVKHGDTFSASFLFSLSARRENSPERNE
jgi:hypothetical protein